MDESDEGSGSSENTGNSKSGRLQVSDSEHYTFRRSEDEGGIGLMLTPYSCLRQMYFTLDKKKDEISVYFQGVQLYNGEIDIAKIRERLLRSGRINYLELVTLLTVMENEPYVEKRSEEKRRIFEKVTYTLAYEKPWEIKKKLDEIMKDTDYEEFMKRLLQIIDTLPWPLKYPMLERLSFYIDLNKGMVGESYGDGDNGKDKKEKDEEKELEKKKQEKQEKKKKKKKRMVVYG